jgi:16S rRNA (cytidine1402-2'-O)-methyltransferase
MESKSSKMPSRSQGNPGPRRAPTGRLFVVATPIGNLDDITIRALDVLGAVAVVAAEDTRHTARLLSRHKIQARLVSYHEHNEQERAAQLLERLLAGESVALVSDAGTPGVSDPGYRLVRAAVSHGVTVHPVPGACAPIAALSAAGLPTDSFVFLGFPPRRKGPRSRMLRELAQEARTLIWYESARRVAAFIAELLESWGDREAVLAREMTKTHEEFLRTRLSEMASRLAARGEPRGEITLLVAGRGAAPEASPEALERAIAQHLAAGKPNLKELSRLLAQRFERPRREVYQLIVQALDRGS